MKGKPQKPKQLRTIRMRVALQIIAAVIFAASVLSWSFGHYTRYDFSRSRKFELSNQSKQTMWNLGSQARIIVYFSPSSSATGSELYGDIMALLREYQFLAHHYRDLTVEKVDPLHDPAGPANYRAATNSRGRKMFSWSNTKAAALSFQCRKWVNTTRLRLSTGSAPVWSLFEGSRYSLRR